MLARLTRNQSRYSQEGENKVVTGIPSTVQGKSITLMHIL